MYSNKLFVLFLINLFIICLSKNSIVLNENDDIKTICASKKCLYKCCRENEYVFNMSCTDFGPNKDYSEFELYDPIYHDVKVNKTFKEEFLLVPGKFYEEFNNDTLNNQAYTSEFLEFDNHYLNTEGIYYLERKNSYDRWRPTEKEYFCIDYELVHDTIIPRMWYLNIDVEDGDEDEGSGNQFYIAGLLISSVFLAIVLVVYLALPELRNLAGMVLMAYVACLLGAFLSLASHLIGTFPAEHCIYLTAVTYFFFLATFCWMSVMSFDIWWTFRGYAKARPIHRRGESFKFGVYCSFALGIPFAMAVGLVVVNDFVDLSDSPWIITPQIPTAGCFIEGGQKLLYLYVPMLILILSNWMFYLMTAFNIWRLTRGTAMLNCPAAGNSAAHQTQKARLMVYVKLSVIMGINWVLEVVSSFTPELKVWNITDAYNLLIGLSIFLIYICKRKIFRKLEARYSSFRVSQRSFAKSRSNSSSSNTISSSLSQEIPMHQVSIDPRGPKDKN